MWASNLQDAHDLGYAWMKMENPLRSKKTMDLAEFHPASPSCQTFEIIEHAYLNLKGFYDYLIKWGWSKQITVEK